jgi:NADH-quinone oxidoreductase subunit N
MLLYLITYTLSTAVVFSSLIGLRVFSKVRYLADLSGLSFFHPGAGVAIASALFSAAGIPPILGFVGKFSVFFASLSSSLLFAALFGVFCSVISTFYYLRLARLIFFENTVVSLGSFSSFYVSQFPKELAVFTGIGAIFLFWFTLNPRPLFFMAHIGSIGFVLLVYLTVVISVCYNGSCLLQIV